MTYPLVTIMIPTYGQARFVGEAVGSALAQDWPNLEVLIADDCSPDATRSAVARYLADPRVRYIRRETNLGRVANYRQTLADARGEWVLNLDGDDYLTDSGFISAAMAQAARDPLIVLVFGQAQTGEIGDLMNAVPPDLGPAGMMDGETFLMRYPPFTAVCIPHLAALYNRARALAIDAYRADIHAADAEMLYRLGAGGRKVAFVPRCAGVWRIHGGNATDRHYREIDRHNLVLVRALYDATAPDRLMVPKTEVRGRAALKRRLASLAAMSDVYQLARSGGLLRLPAALARLTVWCPGLWLVIGASVAGRFGAKVRRVAPNLGRRTAIELARASLPTAHTLAVASVFLIAAVVFYLIGFTTIAFAGAVGAAWNIFGASAHQIAARLIEAGRTALAHIKGASS